MLASLLFFAFGYTSVSNFPQTGGLTTPDILAIFGFVVTIFGLLLTAIGVLVLRTLSGMDSRVAEIKTDAATDNAALRRDFYDGTRALWSELNSLRAFVYNARPASAGAPLPGVTVPPERR